jgi:DNA polymerase alpha subunit A
MSLRTAPHPKTHQNEIVAFAGLVNSSYALDRSAPKPLYHYHFCTVAPPTNCIFPFDFRDRVKSLNKPSGVAQAPSIEVISSERGMLGFILAKIHKVCHYIVRIFNFISTVLIHNTDKSGNAEQTGRISRCGVRQHLNYVAIRLSGWLHVAVLRC